MCWCKNIYVLVYRYIYTNGTICTLLFLPKVSRHIEHVISWLGCWFCDGSGDVVAIAVDGLDDKFPVSISSFCCDDDADDDDELVVVVDRWLCSIAMFDYGE